MGKVCNYSRTKCSGTECKGSVDPLGSVTPDKNFAIYYNTLSKQCFYADGTTSSDWKSLSSYCNISPVEYSPNCDTGSGEGSCIGDAAPAFVPTGENQFFWDKTANVCYRSRVNASGGAGTYELLDWESYSATGQVTLEWEDFTVFGSGVLSGFNIYRRLSGEVFDYDSPINKTMVGVSTRKYVDNAENSWYAPVPKTVYYYDVRPIVNGIPTGVSEDYQNFNIVRLLVPPNNMSFVHQWIVNKSICSLMNSTSIDPDNNFRCIYFGPGSSDVVSEDYYDIGQDYLVDRFEGGCNFTRAPVCGTPTGDCVSNQNPGTASITGPLNSIFYDRSTGTCFRNTDGVSNWTALDGGATSYGNNNHQLANNPPLVNVTQAQATQYCSGGAGTFHSGVKGYTAAFTRTLPSRKEQIAYSLWDDALNTDTQISILETGLSLNSSSKCNSSNASGLENDYSDTAMTNSNTMHTLPGTLSSGIRSVITGSNQTKLCASRFGVQDHVGNIAEFTVEKIDCDLGATGLSVCNSIAGSDGSDNLTMTTDNGASAYTRFGINSVLGPCRDTDSDGECDAYIDKWILDEERYSAGRFIIPLGLPAHVNFPSTNPGDRITEYPYDPGSGVVDLNFLFEIGPSSGIQALNSMMMSSHRIPIIYLRRQPVPAKVR